MLSLPQGEDGLMSDLGDMINKAARDRMGLSEEEKKKREEEEERKKEQPMFAKLQDFLGK